MKNLSISKPFGGADIKLKSKLLKLSGVIFIFAVCVMLCFALYYLIDDTLNGSFVNWFDEKLYNNDRKRSYGPPCTECTGAKAELSQDKGIAFTGSCRKRNRMDCNCTDCGTFLFPFERKTACYRSFPDDTKIHEYGYGRCKYISKRVCRNLCTDDGDQICHAEA